MTEIYTLKKEFLSKYTENQLSDFLKDFKININGDIEIPYEHKGYTCADKIECFKDSKIQAISFFSGAGGLDIGTQLAGVKVLSSLDFFEDSVETLKKNTFFNDTKHLHEDINNISGKNYSSLLKQNNPEKLILVGGPPCQPFSKAGYWITNEKRKANDDPRNMIVPYFRLIEEIKPDGFVLENVESILHPSNKPAVDTIISNIERLGYNYSLLKVNASDYGVPQKRKRVFFMASKNKINALLTQTTSDKDVLKTARVIDWIGKFDSPDFYRNENISIEGKWENALRCVPPGKNYIALSEKAGYPNPIFVAGKRYWTSLLKLHPLLSSWTILAGPGHWEGPFHWTNRRLSLKERAAIQTFPDDYIFHGSPNSIIKQIGNAVPPILAKQIIEELCKWI